MADRDDLLALIKELAVVRGRVVLSSGHAADYSIDLHRVDVARIFVPTTVVGIREDRLVPLPDMRAMVARLQQGRLHEISSVFGHDAFLKESDQLRSIFANVLGGAE